MSLKIVESKLQEQSLFQYTKMPPAKVPPRFAVKPDFYSFINMWQSLLMVVFGMDAPSIPPSQQITMTFGKRNLLQIKNVIDLLRGLFAAQVGVSFEFGSMILLSARKPVSERKLEH
jgi:hypothetical protein